MDTLAERLAKAITDNEQIALFGDYDVDGACSVRADGALSPGISG